MILIHLCTDLLLILSYGFLTASVLGDFMVIIVLLLQNY